MNKPFDPITDDILPNGATILAGACIRGQCWIWLGHVEHNAMPYVTWQANIESPGATYWGHYKSGESDGWKDWRERINLKAREVSSFRIGFET